MRCFPPAPPLRTRSSIRAPEPGPGPQALAHGRANGGALCLRTLRQTAHVCPELLVVTPVRIYTAPLWYGHNSLVAPRGAAG